MGDSSLVLLVFNWVFNVAVGALTALEFLTYRQGVRKSTSVKVTCWLLRSFVFLSLVYYGYKFYLLPVPEKIESLRSVGIVLAFFIAVILIYRIPIVRRFFAYQPQLELMQTGEASGGNFKLDKTAMLQDEKTEFQARRRGRNIAMGLGLAGMCVLFFLVTVAKLGGM